MKEEADVMAVNMRVYVGDGINAWGLHGDLFLAVEIERNVSPVGEISPESTLER